MTNASFTLLRIVLSLVFAALLLVPLWWYGGLEVADLQSAWSRVTLSALWPALALYLLMNLLRTVRFASLIPPAERPGFLPLLGVTSAYSMAATVLPAKIGEASFVLYAKRVCGVSAASGLAALVVSRLLDLATLAGLFSVTCWALHLAGAYPGIPWFLGVGSVLAAISVACFFLSARGDLLVIFAMTIVRWFGLERVSIGRTVTAKAEQVAGALRFAGGEGRLVRAALVSIPIWISIFLFCAVLGRAFGLPSELSYAELAFGSALAIVTSLVPISAFANFGTLEAGWVIGFELLGVPRDLGAATGLGLHVVQVALCVAVGIVGHLIMGATRSSRSSPRPR
ncbi:MAG: lysylphosphatidylglycerol synthase transmembrane domain-containing protein [Planctomycetota bacterium]|nr:lysylphosphatidylglycerol synthase transmembrane domain-containing protein [Planctomycetota bacterium]